MLNDSDKPRLDKSGLRVVSRRSVTGAMAVAAAAAGIGLAWRQHGAPRPDEAALTALWGLSLELPEGGILQLDKFRGNPLVINFWATWCPPCVEELPLLDAFYTRNVTKRWQMIGIAVDNAKSVKQFLSRMPLKFPTPLAGAGGVDLSRSLGNTSGGLPFTVVLNAAGEVKTRHMGQLSAVQIESFLKF
jgi:thiol-disulfide isomerase/thioredoxin